MLFVIENEKIQRRKWEDFQMLSDYPLIACVKPDVLLERSEVFGISAEAAKQCQILNTSFRNAMMIDAGTLYGSITKIDVMDLGRSREQFYVYLQKNRIILVPVLQQEHMLEDMIVRAARRFSQNITLAQVFYAFLDGMLIGGNETLEKIENQMETMEQEMIHDRMSQNLNKEVFFVKKQLSVLINYFEQMLDVAETLKEWKEDMDGVVDSKYLSLFVDKAKRLSESGQEIRENLIHLREAIDANMEYNLNRIMKIFTVVTTVFLPLTLIAGWYGMNFDFMPEIHWKYGYAMVWGISTAVVVFCFLFFYKKNFI